MVQFAIPESRTATLDRLLSGRSGRLTAKCTTTHGREALKLGRHTSYTSVIRLPKRLAIWIGVRKVQSDVGQRLVVVPSFALVVRATFRATSVRVCHHAKVGVSSRPQI